MIIIHDLETTQHMFIELQPYEQSFCEFLTDAVASELIFLIHKIMFHFKITLEQHQAHRCNNTSL